MKFQSFGAIDVRSGWPEDFAMINQKFRVSSIKDPGNAADMLCFVLQSLMRLE